MHFLSAWADNSEPREAAAYVHCGRTSSDLLGTALALQLTDATDIVLAEADRLVEPTATDTRWITAQQLPT